MDKSKKKKGFLFKIMVLPTVFLATFLLLVIGAGYFLRADYLVWESTFENRLFEEDYLYPVSDLAQLLNTEITSKLEKFQESNDDVDFIEFTDQEFILLLHNVVQESLSDNLEIERYYVESGEGLWSIYVESKYRGVTMPWVEVVVEKDPIETPELYVSGLYVGETDLSNYGFDFLIDDINEGYSEGVLVINESALTKRRWANITLGEGVIVIKGKLNK